MDPLWKGFHLPSYLLIYFRFRYPRTLGEGPESLASRHKGLKSHSWQNNGYYLSRLFAFLKLSCLCDSICRAQDKYLNPLWVFPHHFLTDSVQLSGSRHLRAAAPTLEKSKRLLNSLKQNNIPELSLKPFCWPQLFKF